MQQNEIVHLPSEQAGSSTNSYKTSVNATKQDCAFAVWTSRQQNETGVEGLLSQEDTMSRPIFPTQEGHVA